LLKLSFMILTYYQYDIDVQIARYTEYEINTVLYWAEAFT